MANIINTPKLLQAAGFAVEDTSTTTPNLCGSGGVG